MIDVVAQCANPLAVLVAALGVAWAVRGKRKQLEAQLFLTLTEGYEAIMFSFSASPAILSPVSFAPGFRAKCRLSETVSSGTHFSLAPHSFYEISGLAEAA